MDKNIRKLKNKDKIYKVIKYFCDFLVCRNMPRIECPNIIFWKEKCPKMIIPKQKIPYKKFLKIKFSQKEVSS